MTLKDRRYDRQGLLLPLKLKHSGMAEMCISFYCGCYYY